MHFDLSKIFVTKFALKFTEFQKFQPSPRPSAFGCIDLQQPKAKLKVRNLRPLVDHCMSQQEEIELDIVDLMAHPHQSGTQDYLEPLGKLCKSDL